MIDANRMQEIARTLQKELPDKTGFCLITFGFENNNSYSNYISNAQRQDMIMALMETVERLMNNEDFQTPHLS